MGNVRVTTTMSTSLKGLPVHQTGSSTEKDASVVA